MTDPSYRVTWTATALDMVAAIPDRLSSGSYLTARADLPTRRSNRVRR